MHLSILPSSGIIRSTWEGRREMTLHIKLQQSFWPSCQFVDRISIHFQSFFGLFSVVFTGLCSLLDFRLVYGQFLVDFLLIFYPWWISVQSWHSTYRWHTSKQPPKWLCLLRHCVKKKKRKRETQTEREWKKRQKNKKHIDRNKRKEIKKKR